MQIEVEGFLESCRFEAIQTLQEFRGLVSELVDERYQDTVFKTGLRLVAEVLEEALVSRLRIDASPIALSQNDFKDSGQVIKRMPYAIKIGEFMWRNTTPETITIEIKARAV